MRTMADANIVIGILIAMNFATFAIGIWSDRKHRKDIAGALEGLSTKQGVIYQVHDAHIFHTHIISVFCRKNGKKDMALLNIDQALDLLKTRDLDKIRAS